LGFPWLRAASGGYGGSMSDPNVRLINVAGGHFAYVWAEGHQVIGSGRTPQEARNDLAANIVLHRTLRERCERAKLVKPTRIPSLDTRAVTSLPVAVD
jgi:hypothetical protein